MFYLLNRFVLNKSQEMVEDLKEAQRFNAQYHYDKERIDRLKKELDRRANTMVKSNEKK